MTDGLPTVREGAPNQCHVALGGPRLRDRVKRIRRRPPHFRNSSASDKETPGVNRAIANEEVHLGLSGRVHHAVSTSKRTPLTPPIFRARPSVRTIKSPRRGGDGLPFSFHVSYVA